MAKKPVSIDDDDIVEEEGTSKTKSPKKLRNKLLQNEDLVSQLSERSGESKVSVSNVLGALPSVIIDTVSKDKPVLGEVKCVPLPGVGTFGFQFREASDRPSHLKHQNQPEDGSTPIQHIPEHYSPTFRFSSKFRTTLSQVLINQLSEVLVESGKAAKKSSKGDKKPA